MPKMPKKTSGCCTVPWLIGKGDQRFLKNGEVTDRGIVWTVGDKYPLQIMPVYLVLLLFYWERHEVHSCR